MTNNVYNIYPKKGEPLDSAISRALGLNETLDLVGSTKCMREARQPLFRRPRFRRRVPAPKPPKPAVVIIEAPDRGTDAAAIIDILYDSTELTAIGFGDISTIVIVPELDETSLPTGLRDNLVIVPAATPPAASP
ncbi:MAG: hypothetical protein AAFV01_13415 [Bacteroidota bacterium]